MAIICGTVIIIAYPHCYFAIFMKKKKNIIFVNLNHEDVSTEMGIYTYTNWSRLQIMYSEWLGPENIIACCFTDRTNFD